MFLFKVERKKNWNITFLKNELLHLIHLYDFCVYLFERTPSVSVLRYIYIYISVAITCAIKRCDNSWTIFYAIKYLSLVEFSRWCESNFTACSLIALVRCTRLRWPVVLRKVFFSLATLSCNLLFPSICKHISVFIFKEQREVRLKWKPVINTLMGLAARMKSTPFARSTCAINIGANLS